MLKKQFATLAAVGAAVALAGCTDSAHDDSIPEPVPTEAKSPDPTSLEPSPTEATETDREAAKADAIADGRPEPAWDINCVAWTLPDADTNDEQWANEVATTWLDHHDADCPDAITWPNYYVEVLTPGGAGALVATIDDAALEEYAVNPNSDKGLQLIGYEILTAVQDDHASLNAITVTIDGHDRSFTVTPEMYEESDGTLTAP